MVPEMINHLFVSCKYIGDLWSQITKHFYFDVFHFSKQIIILNTTICNPRLVENIIVLLAKFYIYRARCNNERLNMVAFNNLISNIKTIEHNIAIQNNKLTLHDQNGHNC